MGYLADFLGYFPLQLRVENRNGPRKAMGDGF